MSFSCEAICNQSYVPAARCGCLLQQFCPTGGVQAGVRAETGNVSLQFEQLGVLAAGINMTGRAPLPLNEAGSHVWGEISPDHTLLRDDNDLLLVGDEQSAAAVR